jgi:hypothetical protein
MTVRPGTAAKSLTIRLGSVAIRSVAATTKGMPVELGSTRATRRQRPRAARIDPTRRLMNTTITTYGRDAATR